MKLFVAIVDFSVLGYLLCFLFVLVAVSLTIVVTATFLYVPKASKGYAPSLNRILI